MSHAAMSWAFSQVNLDSVRWRFLVLLADCYAPPEMKCCSLSSLQENLGKSPATGEFHFSSEDVLGVLASLEDCGLISHCEVVGDEFGFEMAYEWSEKGTRV